MPESIAQTRDGSQPDKAVGNAVTLAEVLAARICHDLAGGLGTLIGALELACDDATMQDEALLLAKETALSLTARLRQIRAAWGGGEALSAHELREILATMPMPRRARVAFHEPSDAAQYSTNQTQVLLNALMLGVEALAGEGTVHATQNASSISISLQGPNVAWPAGIALYLADENAALRAAISQGPRPLQGPLTALISHQTGIGLSISEDFSEGLAGSLVMPLG